MGVSASRCYGRKNTSSANKLCSPANPPQFEVPCGPRGICSAPVAFLPHTVLPRQVWEQLKAESLQRGVSEYHLQTIFLQLCDHRDEASFGTVRVEMFLGLFRNNYFRLLRRMVRVQTCGRRPRVLFESITRLILDICSMDYYTLVVVTTRIVAGSDVVDADGIRAIVRYVSNDHLDTFSKALCKLLVCHQGVPHMIPAIVQLAIRYPCLFFPVLQMQRALQRRFIGARFWFDFHRRNHSLLFPADMTYSALKTITARQIVLELISSMARPLVVGTNESRAIILPLANDEGDDYLNREFDDTDTERFSLPPSTAATAPPRRCPPSAPQRGGMAPIAVVRGPAVPPSPSSANQGQSVAVALTSAAWEAFEEDSEEMNVTDRADHTTPHVSSTAPTPDASPSDNEARQDGQSPLATRGLAAGEGAMHVCKRASRPLPVVFTDGPTGCGSPTQSGIDRFTMPFPRRNADPPSVCSAEDTDSTSDADDTAEADPAALPTRAVERFDVGQQGTGTTCGATRNGSRLLKSRESFVESVNMTARAIQAKAKWNANADKAAERGTTRISEATAKTTVGVMFAAGAGGSAAKAVRRDVVMAMALPVAETVPDFVLKHPPPNDTNLKADALELCRAVHLHSASGIGVSLRRVNGPCLLCSRRVGSVKPSLARARRRSVTIVLDGTIDAIVELPTGLEEGIAGCVGQPRYTSKNRAAVAPAEQLGSMVQDPVRALPPTTEGNSGFCPECEEYVGRAVVDVYGYKMAGIVLAACKVEPSPTEAVDKAAVAAAREAQPVVEGLGELKPFVFKDDIYIELFDDSEARFFYYNVSTGLSTWRRPAVYVPYQFSGNEERQTTPIKDAGEGGHPASRSGT